MSFESLGLSEALALQLDRLGYASPTPIQRAAIPLILSGRDLLAAAQTGSGKTAAFALPILHRLAVVDPDPTETRAATPRALVLAPTRELAAQVGASFERYGRALPLPPRALIAYGGVGYGPQIEAARAGAEIVVATPGRLLDLVERGSIDLSRVETLALDEADRLLALGFADELNAVLARLPAERQNLLFSATFPAAVTALADALLVDPQRLRIDLEAEHAADIFQRAIEVERDARTALLRSLLETENWPRALVFVATKRRADNVAAKLAKRGVAAAALHADLGQAQRTRALENFKRGKTRVLVATDVAARGLDVEQLSCVVNYDLPRSPADYVHRIGRTGRAGEAGVAISFVTAEDDARFRLIEKRNNLSLPRERVAGFEPAEWNPPPAAARKPPVKGKRKSKKDKLREAAAKAEAGQAASVSDREPTRESALPPADAPPTGPWAAALKRVKRR